MKFFKILTTLTSLAIISSSLVACGNSTKTEQPKESTTITDSAAKTEQKVESKFKFPDGATVTGTGTLVVHTPSGSSENNNVPVVIVQKDDMLQQIDASLNNFQGDKEVFLYINKIFLSKNQGGQQTQTTVSLKEQNLKPGEYTLSAVQFENNDPNGKAIEYHEANYKITQGN